MKQPSKLMKRALWRSKDHEWDKSYLGQTMRETVEWINIDHSVHVLPSCYFTVQKQPLVNHPDIYARIVLYIPSPFSPAKIKANEYLVSGEAALVLTVDLLQAMGAVERARA